MPYWLVKSEPFKYSWDQFVKDIETEVKIQKAGNNAVVEETKTIELFDKTGKLLGSIKL